MESLQSSILPISGTSFLLTSLIIELTPGPNMTYLALIAASEGRRAGLATVAGVALGLALLGAIAAIGVAQIIQTSDLLYEGMRWAGVAFLLFLAWEGWQSGVDVVAPGNLAAPKHFMRGLLTNLLNPKAGIFYVAVLPTFLSPDGSPLVQALTLTTIYVGVATAVHAAIVLLAGALQPFLNNPTREKVARRTLSFLLAVVALWFAWSTGR